MKEIKTSVVAVTKVLAVVMALDVFCAVVPGAQAAPKDAERIEFPNGAIEVNLERTVPANGAKRFIFYGKNEQEVSLTVTPKVKGAALSLDMDNKTLALGKEHVWTVPLGGAYQIQISNADDVDREFTLNIGADYPQNPPASPDAERILFFIDPAEVNWQGTVPANGAKRFVFYVREGQEFTGTITPKVKDAKLSIDISGKTVTQGQLFGKTVKKSDNFQIQILNTDNVNRDFTLNLGVATAPKAADPAHVERIEFPNGAIEVNLERTIAALSIKRFSFSAKQGQEIALTVTSKVPSAVSAGLVAKKMNRHIDVRDGKLFVMKVDKSDDFEISIVNLADISRSYSLDLGVAFPQKKAAPADPERINFPNGVIEVNLERTVPANGAKRFIFSVKVGQEVAWKITPKNKNAKLSIDVSGTPATTGREYVWRARTTSYQIQILNPDDVNQPFTLDLSVQ